MPALHLSIIKILYTGNAVIAAMLYLPQIYNICRDRSHAASLSLITFGGWTAGSIVTTLYACYILNDVLFTVVSLGNALGSGTIFVIAFGKRLASRRISALSSTGKAAP